MIRPTTMSLPFLVVLGALSLSCSGSSEGDGTLVAPSPTTDQPPLDPLAPGASVVCDSKLVAGLGFEPEIYVLSAMNHKLGQYPAFRAASGLDVVSDCASARAFISRYEEYAEQHPNFDADETLAPGSDREPESPPEDPPASRETSKVGFGMDVVNHPIVQLEFELSAFGHDSWNIDPTTNMTLPEDDKIVNRANGKPATLSCTGTFINRNWILTAAHCISAAAVNLCLQRNVPRDSCQPQWDDYGLWRIRGTHSGGRPYVIDPIWARAYVHKNWHGRQKETNPLYCPPEGTCYVLSFGARHDLALLYVRHDDDVKLEPRLEENGAKRLSIVTPNANWPNVRFYGWGAPTVTDPETMEQSSRLRVSTTPPVLTIHPPLEATIEGTVQTDTNSFPCAGDSGGPLMRTGLSMTTNSGMVETGLEAIMGVLSYGFSLCAPLGVRRWLWTRVDTPLNREFIEDALTRWPPIPNLPTVDGFSCKKRALTGTPPPPAGPGEEVAECWGKPCTGVSDTACIAGVETCWNSKDAFRTRTFCPACDGISTGCQCMQGQCLRTTK